MYQVLVKDHGTCGKEAVVLGCSKKGDEIAAEMTKGGFTLVWDSAPTAELGYAMAEEDEGAYHLRCSNCGQFTSVTHMVGTRWNDAYECDIVWNGYICDQCANEHCFKVHPAERA